MFSRTSCYFFVRPRKNYLEVCVFLGRALKAPQIRRVDRTSKTKLAHLLRITHRDQVESPITDWLLEAYELSGVLAAKQLKAQGKTPPTKIRKSRKKAATKKSSSTR